MKNKICLFLTLLLVAACGTHRKAVITPGGKPSVRPAKKDVEYVGLPWVSNVSSPLNITKGLANRHISVWASHGKYFNQKTNKWIWQRPNLFCTNEDLYTQTIVVPYLIPMLEKAGANVFTPRERDWQKNEVIVDNDNETLLPYYTEINIKQKWKNAGTSGFGYNGSCLAGFENPFKNGTARMAKTSDMAECEISYQPQIPEEGRYAVYVSYAENDHNIPDAQYIVYHKGRKTVFNVNQRMGWGTWVYLGTFDFDKGCSSGNRVVVTNKSSYKGVVTADAVRFGGGMGNIARNSFTSGLPRSMEGARYYAQWAGAPDSVYLSKNGTDDYKEDINARPYMTNWLAGSSCFAPDIKGLKVPVELSLAVHSDAGTANDYSSIIGSLAICTTNTNGGLLGTGLSRSSSKALASSILNNLEKDIKSKYGKWTKRDLYDRNYAETRCPLMPSAIIETLSHQNFPDMLFGQDPNFKFTLARSIYKSILRFISGQHGKQYVVAPLTPADFRVEFLSNDTVMLKWNARIDETEPTASSKSYILYTATDDMEFDNGIKINGTACKIKLLPNILYNFKVSATNDGGESFPTETISAAYTPTASKTVLIVNGFQRLSSPYVINDSQSQGFDLYEDVGVSYGSMPGFCGNQICYDKNKIGIEGPGGLGYSGSEFEGFILKGNEFNYIQEHAKAIMSANKYNIASCSKYAVENGYVDLRKYDCVDLILGLEKNDGHSLVYYKSFSTSMQEKLSEYSKSNGNLIVSGAYIGSDMSDDKERRFLNNTLHLTYNGSRHLGQDNSMRGMNTSFQIFSSPNEDHYAATSIDIISPVNPAFCALTDNIGNSVCVAYDGQSNRTFTMGFPFECITSKKKQADIMRGILNFIFK